MAREMQKAQTPRMLDVYNVLADSLLDNALFYFRERIKSATTSKDYHGNDRKRCGRNDTIFGRLDFNFTFEQAMQQNAIIKGAGVTYNSAYQMLKNWRKQGLIKKAPPATSPRWRSFRLEVRG